MTPPTRVIRAIRDASTATMQKSNHRYSGHKLGPFPDGVGLLAPSSPFSHTTVTTTTTRTNMSSSRDPATLQSEIQRLQAELERMRLEEQLQELEQQLRKAQQLEEPEYDDEDEYEEEEVFEDDDGEDIEEETIAEVYDDLVTVHQTASAADPKRKGFLGRFGREKNQPTTASPTTTIAAGTESKPVTISHPSDASVVVAKSAVQPPTTIKSLPYKARVIPQLPPSPVGEETPVERMIGSHVYIKGKLIKASTLACIKDQELILLYFGAKWQRECKNFYPSLKDFYCTANSVRPNTLECFYISSDRSLAEFKEFFATMPFPAMPTGTSDIKNALAEQLKVIDMPTLVVLQAATGLVLTTYGAQDLLQDGMVERNNSQHAMAMIERWKAIPPISFEQVQMNQRLKYGNLQRNTLYWA
jgi:TolA-binding protein